MRAVHAAIFVLPALVVGCASQTVPTPQLDAARAAYDQASRGPAPRYAPQDLQVANRSLDRAQQANAWEDPDQVSFARLSQSRSQLAAAQGYQTLALQQRESATEKLASAQHDLNSARAVAAAEALKNRQQGAAMMQANLPLMRLADRTVTVKGQTKLFFSKDLQFATNQSTLSDEGKSRLDQLAESLPKDQKVIIHGFTDSKGNDKINDPLSERRATAVADYLESKGVSRDQIDTRGFGSNRPIATNENDAGRAKNRRAEVIVDVTGQKQGTQPAGVGATNLQGACAPSE